MRHRIAAVVVLGAALLIGLVWTNPSWAQTKIPRVGILTFDPVTADTTVGSWLEPFRGTLADEGWIEHKNVLFEYRTAHSDPSRYPQAAAELVGLRVDVIFAHSASAVRAAYAATRGLSPGYQPRKSWRRTNSTACRAKRSSVASRLSSPQIQACFRS